MSDSGVPGGVAAWVLLLVAPGAGCFPTTWVTVGDPVGMDGGAGGLSSSSSAASWEASGTGSSSAWPPSSGPATPDAGPGLDGSTDPTITLDPSTLVFGDLTAGHLLMAVTGYDPAARACATLAWDYWGTDHDLRAQCDLGERFPSVSLLLDTDGPCLPVEPNSDHVVTEPSGCVDFQRFMRSSMDMVDVVARVAGPRFTGQLVANNRAALLPNPVTLGIRYQTDVPEDVYAQVIDCDLYQPTWVSISRDGAPVRFLDECFAPPCVEGGGFCGAAICVVENITGGTRYGSIFMSWDGWIRPEPDQPACRPAPPGDYTARFCLAYRHEMGEVTDPFCHDVPFTLPTREVTWYADMGG